jgi:hypothetical protein
VSVAVLVAAVPQLRSALWFRRASAELHVEPAASPTVDVATIGDRFRRPPVAVDDSLVPAPDRRRARHRE